VRKKNTFYQYNYFQDSLMYKVQKSSIYLKLKAFVTLCSTVQKFGVSKNFTFYNNTRN